MKDQASQRPALAGGPGGPRGVLSSLERAAARGYHACIPLAVRRRIYPSLDYAYGQYRRARFARRRLRPPAWLVTKMCGERQEPVRLLIAADGVDARYLASLFGNGEEDWQALGRMSVGRMAATDFAAEFDVSAVLVRTDRAFTSRLRRAGFLVAPEWVRLLLDVPAASGGFLPERAKRHELRDELRRVRLSGFTWDVTTDPEALEPFYRDLYLPYTTDRHGDLAAPASFRNLRALYEMGVLIRIWDGREVVSASLMRTCSHRPVAVAIGVRVPCYPLFRRGITAATFRFEIEWAQQQGYREIDYGLSRPFLEDGVFRYKRKWGMRVDRSPTRFGAFGFKICRLDSATRAFLLGHPMVCTADRGLEGVVFTAGDSQSDRDIAKLYSTAGLRSLRVASLPEGDGDAAAVSRSINNAATIEAG